MTCLHALFRRHNTQAPHSKTVIFVGWVWSEEEKPWGPVLRYGVGSPMGSKPSIPGSVEAGISPIPRIPFAQMCPKIPGP